MNLKEIAFTAYPVTDMTKSRAFYEGVLGLKTSRVWGEKDAPPGWVEYDIGPGCLVLAAGAGAGWPPANGGPAAALEVTDFQDSIARLKAAGVKFLWEAQETPVCWMAAILDPDENRLVIHQRKAG